eukprot:Rhum_TRINITY_DN15140_c6_g1::Rhum_TRINITY_DN15140_c6_g1_i1::g.140491::m.140491
MKVEFDAASAGEEASGLQRFMSCRSIQYEAVGKDRREMNEELKATSIPTGNMASAPCQEEDAPVPAVRHDLHAMDKMAHFDGFDYWPPHNAFHAMVTQGGGESPDDHPKTKWLYCGVIGVLAAAVSFLVKQTTEGIIVGREKIVGSIVNMHTEAHEGGNSSLAAAAHGVALDTKDKGDLWAAWFAWSASSCFLVFFAAAVVVYVEPRASGSGLPEVMAVLNGVQMSKALGRRVIFYKFLSCLFAVASGLPVGPEGPMIHIGAMLGSTVTQGSSKNYEKLSWFRRRFVSEAANRTFRIARERRDFIACGAAAGISAAFGAPLGGLLFVMEEIATHWNKSLTWLIFFGCLTAFFVSTLFMTVFHAWKPTGHTFGSISPEAQVIFRPELILSQVQIHVALVVPGVAIGALCGALAVYFTRLNLAVTRWRTRVVKPDRRLRIIEPLVLAFIYGTATFVVPLMVSCRPLPTGRGTLQDNQQGITLAETGDKGHSFMSFYCSEPGEFSPLGTLTMNSGDTVIKHLFAKGTADTFGVGVLLIYFAMYFIFAAYAAGCTYASGLVIPILVMGSVVGRAVGVGVHAAVPSLGLEGKWADPGVCALVGAASFFAGVSRLTVSLAVIMVELSGELYALPVMMCGIMVAKVVGDHHCHSLYHSLMHLQGLPYLDPELSKSPHLQIHTAGDVAARPVVCVHERETVSTLFSIVRLTHNGLPVLAGAAGDGAAGRGGTDRALRGIILRVQLEALLHAKFSGDVEVTLDDVGDQRDHDLSLELGNGVEPSTAKREAKRDALLSEVYPRLTEAQLAEVVDLTCHASRSPFVVQESFQLQSAYEMFQSLGLRHLLVVDAAWCVRGIITRKDLINLDRRLEQRNLLDADTVSRVHKKRLEHAAHVVHTAEPKALQAKSSFRSVREVFGAVGGGGGGGGAGRGTSTPSSSEEAVSTLGGAKKAAAAAAPVPQRLCSTASLITSPLLQGSAVGGSGASLPVSPPQPALSAAGRKGSGHLVGWTDITAVIGREMKDVGEEVESLSSGSKRGGGGGGGVGLPAAAAAVQQPQVHSTAQRRLLEMERENQELQLQIQREMMFGSFGAGTPRGQGNTYL